MAKTYCSTVSAVNIEGALPYDVFAVNGKQPSTYITVATTGGTVTYTNANGVQSTTYVFVGRNPIADKSIDAKSGPVAGLGWEGNSNVINR